MDKIIATKIADDKLASILKRELDDVIALANESEHEFVRKREIEYQI